MTYGENRKTNCFNSAFEIKLTLIGEQVTPTGTLTPLRTTPNKPKRMETSPPLLEFWTLWQHCKSPVLHWEAGGLLGVGVATARTAKEATARNLVAYMLLYEKIV